MLAKELDALRLDALDALAILDTAPEPAFDQITALSRDFFNVPIVLISLVGQDRQWFKSVIGLGINSTARDIAFCDMAIRSIEVMVVPDAAGDPRFADNPFVTGDPHIRFYAGAPIFYRGVAIGTLSIIDRMARPEFKEGDRLAQLADLVASVMVMRKDAMVSQATIAAQAEAQHKLEMMEQVAGVGYWHVDLKTEEITWSRGVYTIHGVTPETCLPEMKSAVSWYHPDDQPRVVEAFRHAMMAGEDVEVEMRLVRKDGEERNICSRGATSFDSDGNAVSLFGIVIDITDRLKAQKRIEESEARYRLLADGANDIITIYDVGGRLEYVSPSFLSVLGYTEEEAVGQSAYAFIHPEDIAEVAAGFRAFVAGRDWASGFRARYRARHAKGHYLWLEAYPRAVLDPSGTRIVRFQDVVRDVTAQIEAMEKIAVSEAHLRLLADNVPGMVGYWDADLRCRFANRLYEDWFSFNPDELIGMTALELMGPEFFGKVEHHFRLALSGEGQTFEQSRVGDNGENGYFWVQYIPDTDLAGKVIGFYVLATDVTALKLKELALADSNRQLVEARKQAEAATEVKAQFLATMSHEIRTPLTTILGYANVLSEAEDLSEETRSFVTRIGKAGRTLMGLVNDVLDVSRLEAGQVVLDARPTHVRELVHDTTEQFQMAAVLQGLNLTLDYDAGLPDWLCVDETRLSQVLNNLIGNACKFTTDGVVSVAVKAVDSGLMRFEIGDTGPGLSADQIAHLFQRFHQVDNGIARKHGGSGLGLAICREIVRLMDGRIGVDSTVGAGSTFWFEIPLTIADVPAANEAPRDVQAGSAGRVLLVDDHGVNRQMIRALIGPFADEVVEAENGARAIALCAEQVFDLILMDIQMPEVDGLTATRKIRADCPLNSATPIIALTAMTRNRLPAEGVDGLFDQVLAKPIDPRQLHAALISASRKHVRQSERA